MPPEETGGLMPSGLSLAGWLEIAIAGLLGAASLASLVRVRRVPPYLLATFACLVIVALGGTALATGDVATARVGVVLGFPLIDVRIDRLSALFLVMLGVAGTATSIFAHGYRLHGRSDRDPTTAAYPLFIASLALVFTAGDAFAFLVAWEVMALSSAALVVGSRPDPAVARAGYVYLALTHLATVALVAAFAILAAAAGTTDLAAFGAGAATLPSLGRDVVFVLLFVGFATKAGAVPLHIWLPQAHPVAPSHVSALMSGVMIKAGIYGIVRFGILVMGPGPEWWGLLVLVIGVVSAVLGVLYALMEHDLKRLLAYHSIENIGIILIGVGVALLARSDGLAALAGLALAAALFHSLNHALFKSVLFLAAGSVQAAVGSRDLNRLGGLARAMPVTTLAFAIGAAAISGLPPLNGFASEWLTFQGLFGAAGSVVLSPLARSGVLLAVGGLGLTAALAVACFVKATGVGFLALPRSAGAAAARETSRWMGAGMAILAAACVGVGLAAGPIATGIAGIVDASISAVSGVLPVTSSVPALSPAMVGAGSAAYAALGLAALVVGLAGLAWLTGIRRRPVRRAPTWTCGTAPEPAFEYTATSYAKLIRLYFGRILRPVREVTVELHPGTPFPRTVRYRGETQHVLDERLYGPIHRAAVAASEFARRLQNGSLQLYLAYTVTAVVLLLLLAR
jgi:hydrogenase-4 component B